MPCSKVQINPLRNPSEVHKWSDGHIWLWLSIKSEKNSFICKCRQKFANNPACVSSSFANHHANSNIMWDSCQLDNTGFCLMSGRTHSYSGRHTNQLITKQCVVKCKKHVHRATLLFLDIICKRVANKNSPSPFLFCVLFISSWQTLYCLCVWTASGFSTCGWLSTTSGSLIRREKSSAPFAHGRK